MSALGSAASDAGFAAAVGGCNPVSAAFANVGRAAAAPVWPSAAAAAAAAAAALVAWLGVGGGLIDARG